MWQRKINEIIADHGLTHVQYLLLATIVWMDQNKMDINQNSLAKQAQSHKMMTSKVLRSLEKQGLILRFTNRKDTRYKNIRITEKGYDKYLAVQKIFKKVDASFFGGVERNRFSLNRIFTDIIEDNLGLNMGAG
jgi:DNA-binding MarR family transcriptional regulator